MILNGTHSIFKKSCLASIMGILCMPVAYALQPLSDDSLSESRGEGVALVLEDFKMVFQAANDRSSGSSYARGVADPGKFDTGFIRLIPTGENYQQISDRAFAHAFQSAYDSQYSASYTIKYATSRTSEFNRIQANERTAAYNELNAAMRTQYTNDEKAFVEGTVAQERYQYWYDTKYNNSSWANREYWLWSTERKQNAAKADATNDVNTNQTYITQINNKVTTRITNEANQNGDRSANEKATIFALAEVDKHVRQEIRTIVNSASNINNQKTKADVFIYGLALSRSDDNLNSRFSNLGFNWGDADNPWLLYAGTQEDITQFSATPADIGYIAFQAPLMTTSPTESDNNIKLGMWLDIFAREFNSTSGVNGFTGAPMGGLNSADRLRLQVIANGLSLNGSQIRLFQTQPSSNENYNQTLGMTNLIRLNTDDRPDLLTSTSANLDSRGIRISTAARDNDSDGWGATPALGYSIAPIFNEFEGLYLYSPNINLVLGNMHQPFILASDGNNIILEVTRIPDIPEVYNKIYQNYGGSLGGSELQGTTCNVFQCGTAIKNHGSDLTANYQGHNATHSSIAIGSVGYSPTTNQMHGNNATNSTGIMFKDANGTAKNLGSAVIDGVLIQHFKIKTTGL